MEKPKLKVVHDKRKEKTEPPVIDILDQDYWMQLVWYARKPALLKHIAEKMFNDKLEWCGELDGEPINQFAFFKSIPEDEKFKKECRGYEGHDLECICRQLKHIQMTREEYLPDGEEGQNDGNWQHGFNSGCLAILREIDIRQEEELYPHVSFDRPFPNLDS
tara:strand:+ start:164 stop:649 length:486 start_codon:yes stop_codon:yes gene_type:complete